MRRLSLVLVILATIALYFALIIGIAQFPIGLDLTSVFFVTAFGLIVIVMLALFYWWEDRAEALRTVRSELKVYKKLAEMREHTYRVIESTKEIKILNDEGDVAVRYQFHCENTSERNVDRIRLRIQHDGNIESVHCEINQKEVQPEEKKELITIDAKTRKEIDSMAHTLIFYISPQEAIKPENFFDYSYSYVGKKLYPRLKEKNQEYTSTSIQHPTVCLNTLIHAPEGFVFSDLKIEVLEREDSRHIAEEERVSHECPPMRVSEGKMIFWPLKDPLLASTYRIFFTINAKS
jgi:hypothetical protein